MKFDFDNLPNDESEVIEHHSRSFSLAAKLLPKAIRSDVEKLYAWCRWCDEAVDAAPNPRAANNRLELLRCDVRRIYAGETPVHPASKWFANIASKYGIPIDLPLDLLAGMKLDVSNPVLESEEELLNYSYQAAGTVGL